MPVNQNRKRVAIRYFADDGKAYSYVTSYNHARAVGAVPPQPGDPRYPKRWKPRTVNLVKINNSGADKHLQVVAPDRRAAIWRGTQANLNIAPFGNMDICGRSGELRSNQAGYWDGKAEPNNERVLIRYIADDGNPYLVATTRAHAFAVGAPIPVGNEKSYPKGWTPRHWYLKAKDLSGADQKMQLIAPDAGNPFWMSTAIYDFTIPGAGHFVTTGRKDEMRPRGAPNYTP